MEPQPKRQKQLSRKESQLLLALAREDVRLKLNASMQQCWRALISRDNRMVMRSPENR